MVEHSSLSLMNAHEEITEAFAVEEFCEHAVLDGEAMLVKVLMDCRGEAVRERWK
ncbi:hypothetical protein Tcan_08334 [Toxocara canis]|uniref:Uncharacterized protein n=1 Tax=Toxocara canis TaxID=6265 RepID=A0A0B2VU25_TOXCA|nr:hypothetical protein Tcan_08334 [Toxocara canis]